KPEAESHHRVATRIVELNILIEDRLQHICRNSPSCISHGNSQIGAVSFAANCHRTNVRVSNRVGDKVVNNALEQHSITASGSLIAFSSKTQALLLCSWQVVEDELPDHFESIEVPYLGRDRTAFQA